MSEKPDKDEKRFDDPNKKQKPITAQSLQSNEDKLKLISEKYKHKTTYFPQYPSVQQVLEIPELSQMVSDYDLFCDEKCSNISETLTLYEGCNCIKEILYELFSMTQRKGHYIINNKPYIFIIHFEVLWQISTKSNITLQYRESTNVITMRYYEYEGLILETSVNLTGYLNNKTDFYQTLDQLERSILKHNIRDKSLFDNIVEISLYYLDPAPYVNFRIQFGSTLLNSLFSYASYNKVLNRFTLKLQDLFLITDKPNFLNDKFVNPFPMTFVHKPKALIETVAEPSMATTAVIAAPVVEAFNSSTIPGPKSGGNRYKKLKINLF